MIFKKFFIVPFVIIKYNIKVIRLNLSVRNIKIKYEGGNRHG